MKVLCYTLKHDITECCRLTGVQCLYSIEVFLDKVMIKCLRERKRCGLVGSSPCYSQSEVVYAYQVIDL